MKDLEQQLFTKLFEQVKKEKEQLKEEAEFIINNAYRKFNLI